MSAQSTQKCRILFLNRSYWPDSEATGQLLTALCESLAEDFDVHVLAGQPNATAVDSGWQDCTIRNGVTIHRAGHTTFPKSNMLLKGLNFVSFVAACRKEIKKLPVPDVVVFETDPFLLPFVADRLQRMSGCKMIGYLQDIYPDVAVALGKVGNNWMIRRLRRKMFDVYRRCEKMVVLSTDMKRLLLDDQIPEHNVSIIPNWADTNSIYPVTSGNVFLEKNNLTGKFVAMYSGNLGLTQRLEEFVQAAELLSDDSDIQFVFVGRGARKANLQSQVKSLGLSNVMFLDYQPLDELAHSLSAADLHLVPLTEQLSQCLMPSKLYGILAAGRPFLTNAPERSELHQLTKTHEIGFAVEAGSPEKIAAKIREVKARPDDLRAMGQRCRQLAESRYTKKHATSAFVSLLHSVMDHSAEKVAC